MVRFLYLLCLALLAGVSLRAQCTSLACNNAINVGLGQSGVTVITPDLILTGQNGNCPGPKAVEVRTLAGVLVPNATVDCSFLGQTLEVTAIDLTTGNSCWGFATVDDEFAPLLSCADVTISCSADASPAALGFPTVTDNCPGAAPNFSFFDSVADQACSGNGTARVITRTFFANVGGQTATCVQTITVTAATLADVVFPADTLLDCSNADTSALLTGLPTVFGAPVGLSCKLNLLYTDLTFSDCPGNLNVVRRFTVIDCCTGATRTADQVISVRDTTPPSFVCPDTLRVTTSGQQLCTGAVILPPLLATDDCSGPVTTIVSTPGGTQLPGNGGLVTDLPLGNSAISYTVSDACGNTAICTVPVVVTDNQPPVMVCDELTSVSVNSTGLSTVPAFVFDDGGYDACCGPIDSFEVRRMADPLTAFAPSVTFDCDDVGDTVQVVVRGFDCFGNFNECMVQVEVEDKILPNIVCPPDVTLDCAVTAFQPIDLGLFPTATDNCTLGTIVFSDDTTRANMCGPLEVQRTFRLLGPGAFRDSCTQTITFVDSTPPVFTFPPDVTLTCTDLEAGLDTGSPTVDDDCGLPFFFLNVADDTITFDNCELKLVRQFTYLDMCTGFDTTAQQTIKLVDDAAPVFDAAPLALDTLLECITDTLGFVPPVPTATDGCNNGAVVSLVSDVRTFAADTCRNEFVRVRTFVAEDQCGNVSAPFAVTLTVADTVAPVFLFCPPDTLFIADGQCAAFLTIAEPIATDNCGTDVTLTNDFDKGTGPITGVFPLGTTTITYTATDECGNASTCSTQVTVLDGTPPLPASFLNNQLIRLNGEGFGTLDLDEVTVGIRDNCNSLPVSIGIFAPELGSDTVFVCRDTPLDPDAPSLVVPIDTAFTRSFCNQPQSFLVEIYLADSLALDTTVFSFEVALCRPNANVCPDPGVQICVGAVVGGSIFDAAGARVADVDVYMEDADQRELTATNANGAYYFPVATPPAGSCAVYPRKTDELLVGVSTYDVVLLSRHILGTAPIVDPYRLIAADVNRSGGISALDIVALRRAILYLDDSFPNNDSYRFVPADHVFGDPLTDSFPEAYTVDDFSADELGLHFVAVKVGDLNPAGQGGLAAPHVAARTTTRLTTPDRAFAAGQSLRVPVYAEVADALYGVQGSWRYDAAQLQYEGVEAGGLTHLTDDHLRTTADGKLYLSYAAATAHATDEAPLFYLRFRAHEVGTLSAALALTDELLPELYGARTAVRPFAFGVEGGESVPAANAAQLYPNRPNPFRSETAISFYLPTVERVTLRVTDAAGRVLWQRARTYAAGRHTETVATGAARGVLFYQLITPAGTQTRRMVAH